MKKNSILFIFFWISTIAISQNIEKEEISGNWVVEKNVTKSTDVRYKDLIEGFSSSKFIFYDNGNFELNSPNKSKLFLMTMDMLKNKKWKLDTNRQLIKIGSEKDYFTIIGIQIKKNEGKIIFHIDESELEFEMKKL